MTIFKKDNIDIHFLTSNDTFGVSILLTFWWIVQRRWILISDPQPWGAITAICAKMVECFLPFEQLYEPVTTDTLIEKAGGTGGGEPYSHWLGCI